LTVQNYIKFLATNYTNVTNILRFGFIRAIRVIRG